MELKSRLERKNQIKFAVGMAALDGGKPTAFTQNLSFFRRRPLPQGTQ